uniref:Uncharacterized protein LOC113789672 n=1 Tax=Dermatophagoides pteronyssinus TaxID=6956 RepID=A0A6P6XQA3_DERPT|nr:uncharacterized protein LOC113789672 [Dermatophagoides pteronyssinus]
MSHNQQQQNCCWGEVILLDGRSVEILIQPRLFAGDLFDTVASHFDLKEKEYFGLAFLDETGQYNWLNLEKRVLEHDVQRQQQQQHFVLYFLVKYFIESITMLQDVNTIELFYLQAKSLLTNEIVQVDLQTGLKLSAFILQATYGDCNNFNEIKIRNRIHRLQLISSNLLAELTSYQICEDRIIDEYRQLSGLSYGESIFRFMCLIEKQPTYGVHFYEVKDKSKQPYWLGLSFKGIDQFSYADRRLPLKQFAWKQLENLYFRECKFSIEVRDLKRVVHTLSSINLYENAIEDPDTFDDLSTAICDPTTQVSVSRRTFGPCNVTVFVWFASTSSLTKCIWSMAISQHQFYIDRHINKSIKYQQRAKDDIVQCLNENHNRRRNQIKQLWFQQQQQQRNSYCSNNSIRNSLYSTTTTTVSSSIDHSMNQQSSLTLPRNVTLGFNNHHQQQHQQRQYRLGSNAKSTSQHNNNNNNNKSSSLISLNHIVQQQDVSGCLLDNRHPSLINNNNNNNKLLSSSSSSSGVSRTNSQTTISSQHHSQRTTQLNRQQPFRHSTSTSSINKMSTTPTTPSSSSSSTIAVRGSWIRNSRLDRLRQLQLQLQNKMDELNRLDMIEQQILSKAIVNYQPQELINDTSSIMTSTSLNSSSSSSSSSNIDHSNQNRGSIASSSTSSSLFNNNVVKAPNSLKNFVVTGRASSSLSSNAASTIGAQNYHHIDHHNIMVNNNVVQHYNRGRSPILANYPQQQQQNHQRSKSVGVSSRFSIDQNNDDVQSSKLLMSPSIVRKSNNVNDNQVNHPLPTTNQIKTATNHPKQQQQQQARNQSSSSLIFSSPYVNKYDTSVQSLLKSNERSNLYSVPNRRTSVALNSLDDTVIMNQSRPSTISSNSSLSSSLMYQQQPSNKYSIRTSTVTSSTNSLTYSTISYHLANNQTLRSRNNSLSTINDNDRKLIESNVDDNISMTINNNNNDIETRSTLSNYRNIDEKNLADYKSFLLSRRNSFGSNRSLSSSAASSSTSSTTTSKSSTKSTSIKQMDNNRIIQPNTESESNYVNLCESKRMLPPLSGVGSHQISSKNNNSDYVNLIMSSKNSLSSSNVQPPPSSQQQQQQHYQNHIYQNSQNLMSSKSSIQRRPQQPKTWFETDLDYHHMKFVKQQQSSSIYKPIIKPSNNLVFSHLTINDNDCNNDSTKTIYHPIHLVTTTTDNDDNDDHDEHEQKQIFRKSPTPSQLSNGTSTTTSSSSSLMFNQQQHQQHGSSLYSNLPSKRLISSSPSTTTKISNGGIIDGSLLSLTSSSSSSASASSTSTVNDGETMITTTLSCPPPVQALSPICTVAFIPSEQQQDTTITTIASTISTTTTTTTSTTNEVPIASCKGNIVEVDVVTVGHFQPGYEETKPFTMSDFYKYSQRYRQSQLQQQQQQQNLSSSKINEQQQMTTITNGQSTLMINNTENSN